MRVEATLPPLVEPPRVKAPEVDLTCGAGAELKRVREALRISQKEVADAVGLERTSITNIERGRQKLSLVTFKAIADALGMEIVIHLKPKAVAASDAIPGSER
jgi:transcriptional regulator with XRE-family HTH domain